MILFFKRFFSFLLIASIPLLILLAGYVYYDPFKILKNYEEYSYSQPVPHVIPNRDFVNTAIFLKTGKEAKYNSFVFGSSRTSGITAASWKNYLAAEDKVFFFDASGEAIYGIYTKLKFLDKVGAQIDNALILFCRDAVFEYTEDFDGHLTIKHPATSGGNWLRFHFVFFKAYLNLKFLASFYNYTFTGELKPFMKDYIDAGKTDLDPISNGVSMAAIEAEISKDPPGYYESRNAMFYERKGESLDSMNRIDKTSLYMLKEIKKILLKHNTRYKIILSPIYDQMKFSPGDLRMLTEIFGNNLYDFTGKNAITSSKYNWYETKHFRTYIGDSILNVIYQNPLPNRNTAK